MGSIPLREPSTRSRRGSRRVEGPGARRLARLGPARRKHGAPEGRARSSPWHSWCCSLVPGRTSPWSSGLLSFHSLVPLDFVRVRNTPACTGAPLFFSLTLRRRRRTSDKISSSRIQKFPPPHPALFPKIGSKSRHTRIGAGILQQERLSTCHQERQRPQKSRKARDLGTDTSLEGSPASPKESKIGRA